MTEILENLESSQVEPLVRGKTWEEMKPGSTFRTAKRTVTEADLVQFITWGGFNEPLFYDASHAKAGGYSGRLIPGAMIYCIAEGLILQTNVLNGTGLAFMHMELSVKRPVYVGDTLHALVHTVESRASSKPGRGVVTAHVSVRNQRDEEVLVFTPVRLIRGADYQEAEH
ncbi:MaoC/PaaZ C-terminal domain-containing protein [Streptomyces gilvus]|uniref:MaoC/PaaZ C-terminal domain-containing protein n=1 Tax=Streptomyces gilvus TaxID=2920937 RepID=UPI001F0D16AC|nr:MaoC/PaaZ C-terminal domain-containing protein [Streptomyces sp. CME 23]MCH5675625.1 MaoC family dehydratase N-terminal domain-containing protein [Streptomyces sp. CME 23]